MRSRLFRLTRGPLRGPSARTPFPRTSSWVGLLAATLFPFLLLVACSGSGGGGGTAGSAGSSGTVGVLITDGPTDDFTNVEVTISKIELLGEQRVVLFEGSETFDLLQLENFSNLFSVTESVPVGGYEKIRLHVDDLVLVRETDDGPEEIRPKLPGGGKLDLNPRGTFFVVPGGTLLLEIDMDAKKSIKVVEAGNSGKVIFRPVVFVRVLSDPRDVEKLARIHGTIRTFSSPDAFELCSSQIRADDVDSDSDSDGRSDDSCLMVNLFEDTTAFDDLGDPVDPSFLMAGDPVTVVGNLASLSGGSGGGSDGDSDSDTDTDSRDDTDSDSDTDSDNDADSDSDTDSDGDSDTDSDSEFDMDEARLRLDAIVLEMGPLETWPRLAGEVASEVDADDVFDLDFDPGQGFPDPTVLPVLLRPETAVLARDGFRIDRSEILPGTPAEVDGVIDDSVVPEEIKAALVLLGIPDTSQDSASGEIADLEPPDGFLNLLTGDGAVCVETDAETRILLVGDDGSTATSQAVALEALSNGLQADAYGVLETGGCLQAESLIAIAE